MNGFRRTIAQCLLLALATGLFQGQADPVPPPPPIIILPPQLLPRIVPLEPWSELASITLPIVGDGFSSDHQVAGDITPLVKALRSETYQDREKASQALLCLPADRLQDVTAALAVETDPEAISRLKTAAGHLFLKARTNVKGKAGFLGIGAIGQNVALLGMKFDGPDKMRLPGGKGDAVVVRVNELQPGFPAAQELRPGDNIVAIAGKPFPEEMAPVLIPTEGLVDEAQFLAENTNRSRMNEAKTMFQSRVRSLWPGSVVIFTLVRDGKVIDVPVQLAALSVNEGENLTSLVDLRNRLMAEFVESLKTGEKVHARGPGIPIQTLQAANYDWDNPLPKFIFGHSDWGDYVIYPSDYVFPERP